MHWTAEHQASVVLERIVSSLSRLGCSDGISDWRFVCSNQPRIGAFAAVSRVTPQVLQGLLLVSRIFGSKTGQRIGHDVTVMQPAHSRLAAEVKPQPMHQLNIVGLQCRRMWSNMKSLRFAIRPH